MSPTTTAIDEAAARLLMLLKFPKSPTLGLSRTSSTTTLATKGGKAGKQTKILKLAAVGTPPTGRFNKFRTVSSSEAGGNVAGTPARGPGGAKAPAARKQRTSKPSGRTAAARDLLAAIARGGKTPSPPPTNKKGGASGKGSRAAKRSPKSRTVGGGGGGGGAGAAGGKEGASQAKKARRSPATVAAGTSGVPGGGAAVAHAAAGPGEASFFIKGTQGQLDVCEYRTIEDEGGVRPYLLVRLRGQSNTLPNDASLSVNLPRAAGSAAAPAAGAVAAGGAAGAASLIGAGAAAAVCGVGSGRGEIEVSFSRVRLKAGGLKYDYLPSPVKLPAVDAGAGREFEASLLASIFSKKCWQGMVVRGPRMFIAYIKDGSTGENLYHSVPMFVEISPTSNSPEYRDPVLEYSREVLQLFFADSTVTQIYAGAPSSGGAKAK